MKNYTELLEEWDKAYYSVINIKNNYKDLISLRSSLVEEEYDEFQYEMVGLLAAIESGKTDDGQTEKELRPKVLKELCDLVYTAIGTATVLGMDFDTAFRIVHENNMQKFNKPSFNESGKTLKKNNHPKPNLEDCV